MQSKVKQITEEYSDVGFLGIEDLGMFPLSFLHFCGLIFKIAYIHVLLNLK